MIIVAGYIDVAPGARDEFISASRAAVIAAGTAPGCEDFAVTSDILEPDRVRIFERWHDEKSLEAFKDGGPGDNLNRLIVRAAVRTFKVEQCA